MSEVCQNLNAIYYSCQVDQDRSAVRPPVYILKDDESSFPSFFQTLHPFVVSASPDPPLATSHLRGNERTGDSN